ncbi:hypothetical protein GCM10023321_18980 [Pseudonocardia eucalypti]|uniref:Septum formation initiator family protein n=1 Tax=Pseudonocardia eucalypti TaxID=648755 RepID=A0ABP9PUE9_9PSEU|nr:cell division protein FtsB [Pseudonocardia eucalypti]
MSTDPARSRKGRDRRPGARGVGERSAGIRASSTRSAGGRGSAGPSRLPSAAGPTPGGKVRAGVSGGAPEAIRGSRAHRMAVATSGILGVSSTRRAAVLALVVCALALTVAMPLRNFLTQRQELAALEARQHQLASEVDRLSQRRDQLRDPAAIAAEARERLGYVRPGETPYVVQLPGDANPVPAPAVAPGGLWYDQLWNDVRGVPK